MSSVEIFDPATLTWSATASMSQPRADFTLVRLQSGKLLAAAGSGSSTAEIFDPATGAWTATGAMHSGRAGAAYTALPDGRVMVAGGNFGRIWPFCDSTAEIYDPSTDVWTSTGSMAEVRRDGTATVIRMPDGSRRVLAAGGHDNRGGGVLSSAELYDPATNSWTATGSMTTARTGHTATLMTANGLVLVTGGFDGTAPVSSAEIYDPATGTWTAVNSMATARSSHTATQLLIPGTTKVAVIGGSDGSAGLAAAELFQPTPIASRIVLSASGACSPITLTASVTSTTGSGAPTGTVQFTEGIFGRGSATLDAFGQASVVLTALPDGLHEFAATYSGDDAFAGATTTLSQPSSTTPVASIPGTFLNRALGTSVLLPVSVSGGTSPYTYTWRRGSSTLSGGATLTDTPPLGVSTYEVVVTDTYGCVSAGALKQIDVFDFSLALSTSDVTLFRSGYPRRLDAAVTLAPGSSTNGLPASADLDSVDAPPDLMGLSGTLAMPQTPGGTLVTPVSLQAGATSLGDYAVSVFARSRGGHRVAPLNLHLLADATAPLIVPTVTGTAGANGWYVSDVTVSLDRERRRDPRHVHERMRHQHRHRRYAGRDLHLHGPERRRHRNEVGDDQTRRHSSRTGPARSRDGERDPDHGRERELHGDSHRQRRSQPQPDLRAGAGDAVQRRDRDRELPGGQRRGSVRERHLHHHRPRPFAAGGEPGRPREQPAQCSRQQPDEQAAEHPGRHQRREHVGRLQQARFVHQPGPGSERQPDLDGRRRRPHPGRATVRGALGC